MDYHLSALLRKNMTNSEAECAKNLVWKDGKLEYDWVKPFGSIFVAKDRHTWGGYAFTILNSLQERLIEAKGMVKTEFTYQI